jgi:predicted RNase H-like HicB family nuclease
MKIEVAAQLFPEGSFIVAHVPALDVASFGKTQNEAVHSLIEALTLFLKVSQERGTLERILLESGFVLQGDIWKASGPTEVHGPTKCPVSTEYWTPDNMIPLDQITQRMTCVEI